jgi:hypothetical protein
MLVHQNKFNVIALVAIAATLLLAACSVNVKDSDKEKGEKNVDIRTPVGSIHVRNEAEVADTGLSVYPGAHRREKTSSSDSDNHAANVNISSSMFGVKVVAIEYETDDSPDKVKAYYRKELGKWGKVLECPGGSVDGVTIHDDNDDSGSKELTCGKGGHGDSKSIELKSGTKDRQHIVEVKPTGKGTDFGLVYVQTRGKEGEI